MEKEGKRVEKERGRGMMGKKRINNNTSPEIKREKETRIKSRQ